MDLGERILSNLSERPGQKAREIARVLGVDKKEVNSFLYGRLRGKVRQDKSYCWYVVGTNGSPGAKGPQADKKKPDTVLARLCRYYLECLSQDAEQGVSVFARSAYGTPDYVELDALPMVEEGVDWAGDQALSPLIRKARRERARLAMYVGYPTRLRYHQTSRWKGFFVEPLFLFPIKSDSANAYGSLEISSDMPVLSFQALKSLTEGGSSNVLEEAVELAEQLGMNNEQKDLPEIDEVFLKLVDERPEWDWREKANPYAMSRGPSLAEIDSQGIYNRAVFIIGERSPYTQGLEIELKKLSDLNNAAGDSALGNWLSGRLEPVGDLENEIKPLIEVVPLNTEQREAIRRSMKEPLTVITGPPGTGKSQVVSALLINAAWSGQKVLFASKNNKAVDVVEARVNGLGSRPVLVRLGSNEYQAKLGEYLSGLLGATCSPDDKASYDDNLAIHEKLVADFDALQTQIKKTMDSRNTVDRLDQAIGDQRQELSAKRFETLKTLDVETFDIDYKRLRRAVRRAQKGQQSILVRPFWKFISKGRYKDLGRVSGLLTDRGKDLGLKIPVQECNELSLPLWIRLAEKFEERLEMAGRIQHYFEALNFLKQQPSLESMAKQALALNEKLANNAQRLWWDWVKLQPSRIDQDDRKLVADYASVLQTVTDSRQRNERLPRKVLGQYYSLLRRISHVMPCWAVTSLSANGRVPFEESVFDLLVIDEASQCDIASALPLLFRCKRTVVIGDPKQLTHISTISARRDALLQEKHGVVEGHASWMYSVNSLYHLATSLSRPEDIISLRDHHRSHQTIIDFSNRFFYEGKLRIATSYDRLEKVRDGKPAVRWHRVSGEVIRPANGGAVNKAEANDVVVWLKDLVLNKKYQGTVGVVSPFRAQANLIRKLVFANEALAEKLDRADFLVDTVHRFQGDERDVMVFSPVVSRGISRGALSFLKNNGNLFNVAITRARALLHVVGDHQSALHCGVAYLEEFAKYVDSLGKESRPEEYDTTPPGPEYPPVSRPELVSEWERIFYRAMYKKGIRPIPQYDVDQYVLDFALFKGNRKLNIEVDGERYHRAWNGELCRRDQLRNQRLIELGWEVKRFWVYQIRDEMGACLDWINDWPSST